MNWETYIAIGDSITKGARTYLGYPEKTAYLLKQELKKDWNVINISENGSKAIDIVRLFDKELANISFCNPGIATILIGTNDVKENTNPSEFKIAYNLLVLKVLLITQKNNVILIKIPKFPQGVMYPYNFKMNDTIDIFNSIIEEISIEFKIRLLQFELNQEGFFDGVHLNNQGINNSASQLLKFILRDKGK
ncbi:MAG: SGNH/GDSL hydrolase family protein [Bacteroidales bacterium]|nr:SGNH/GDSL hydrolase family protein [Bacteroidales bacterium]